MIPLMYVFSKQEVDEIRCEITSHNKLALMKFWFVVPE